MNVDDLISELRLEVRRLKDRIDRHLDSCPDHETVVRLLNSGPSQVAPLA